MPKKVEVEGKSIDVVQLMLNRAYLSLSSIRKIKSDSVLRLEQNRTGKALNHYVPSRISSPSYHLAAFCASSVRVCDFLKIISWCVL